MGRAVVAQNDALQRENYPDFRRYTCTAQQGTESQVIGDQRQSKAAKGNRFVDDVEEVVVTEDRATADVVYHFEKAPDDKITTPMTFARKTTCGRCARLAEVAVSPGEFGCDADPERHDDRDYDQRRHRDEIAGQWCLPGAYRMQHPLVARSHDEQSGDAAERAEQDAGVGENPPPRSSGLRARRRRSGRGWCGAMTVRFAPPVFQHRAVAGSTARYRASAR